MEMATLKFLNSMDITTFDKYTLQEVEVTPEDAFAVLVQATSPFLVSSALDKMAKSAHFRGSDSFMSFLSIGQTLTTRFHGNTDNDQMRNLLHSWNLKRVDIPGDGDCLFSSGLIQRIQHGDDAIKQVLLSLGVPEGNLNDICTINRLLCTNIGYTTPTRRFSGTPRVA